MAEGCIRQSWRHPRGIFGKAALRQLRKRAEGGESKLIELINAQIDKAIRKRDTRAAEFLRDGLLGIRKPKRKILPARILTGGSVATL